MLGAQHLEGRGVSYPVVIGPPPSLQRTASSGASGRLGFRKLDGESGAHAPSGLVGEVHPEVWGRGDLDLCSSRMLTRT